MWKVNKETAIEWVRDNIDAQNRVKDLMNMDNESIAKVEYNIGILNFINSELSREVCDGCGN